MKFSRAVLAAALSLSAVLACAEDARPLVKLPAPAQEALREEMLGNLIDNACKWTRDEVDVVVRLAGVADASAGRRLLITVDDNGPGLTEEQRKQGIKRGRRLDESKPGSGLGHSIVADLAQSYRGTFTLEASEAGGLRACLDLPAA